MKLKFTALKELLLTCASVAAVFLGGKAQSYNLTYASNAGNPPGGLVTTDLITSGTIILGSTTMSVNQWSATQTLPFPFTFYGVPVTQYKVSANGVLTFDVASALLPGDNVALPTPLLPDLSIAFMWDDFTNAPPTGSGDYCRVNTFGTAPNRQHWIWYYSYEIGNPNYSFAYWAVVLEESTNNIYVVDQYSIAGTSGTSVGVQLNSTTAIQDSNSPNITRQGNGTTLADNDLWTFQYLTAPCAGTPAVGTVSGPDSTCVANAFTLTVTGTTPAVGLAYQWQTSPNGFVWSDIPGATNTSYSGNITGPTNFRRMDVCTNTNDTSYTNVHFVDDISFLNCYCTSNATSTADEDIQNVTFADINNTSASMCNTYTDYTSTVTGIAIQGLSYPISITTGDCENQFFYNRKVAVWIDYNQNGSFTDPGELVFDPAYAPGAATQVFNGTVAIPYTSTPGVTRMRIVCVETTAASINPCGTYTWGETEDYYLNILPPPTDEAGVLAISRPEVAACSLGNQIWVDVQNLGSNDLTSANFTVKVNGLNIPVSNPWTGNVPAMSTSEVLVPVNYALADGDSVYVEVSMPNGTTEASVFAFNNMSSRRVYQGLSGVKTVYGTAPNYVDIDAAIDELAMRGVCDTVYFQIATGNYTTNHVFVEYPGAGAGKLAVFESATGNNADVAFDYTATGAADNYVFRFDGADGYMLRNIMAHNSGVGFSTAIDIRNGSDNLTFEGNVLMGDTSVSYNTGDFNNIVVSSAQATNDMRTTLRNNSIMGGNRAINLGGATGLYETGNVLEGNTISHYAYIGVIFGNLSDYTVKGNIFRPRTGLSGDAYSIYATGTIDGAMIEGNDIQTMRTGGGILLNNVKGGAQTVAVSNNFVYMGDTNATAISRGIAVQDVNSSDVELLNNSISLSSDNASSAGIALIDGSQIRIHNNNVGAFGTAPAARVEKSYSVSASDYNNMYGSNLAYVLGNVYTSLANFQAGTGFDMNSVSVDPGFNGMDLHTCAPALNGAGMAMANVTEDFDGDARGTMPDIGADEFMGDANNLLVEDAFLKCPDDMVSLGNTAVNGVTYAWSPSGSGSEISTSTAGTYVITATSSCGSFSDTAVVTDKPLPTANFTSVSVGLAGIFTNTSANGTSYLWDFGDGATSVAENPTHVYQSAGTYSVSLTVTNDCGSATFGPTPINAINASVAESEMESISLYPNPTSGVFTLKLGAGFDMNARLNIIDVTGKSVINKNISAGTSTMVIDATELASGVYSVKFTYGNTIKVIRLVKN